jgi:hypothetical protein
MLESWSLPEQEKGGEISGGNNEIKDLISEDNDDNIHQDNDSNIQNGGLNSKNMSIWQKLADINFTRISRSRPKDDKDQEELTGIYLSNIYI